MNNLEEKLYKSLAPDFVPEDSLNAFILKKAMEMEKIRHKLIISHREHRS